MCCMFAFGLAKCQEVSKLKSCTAGTLEMNIGVNIILTTEFVLNRVNNTVHARTYQSVDIGLFKAIISQLSYLSENYTKYYKT